MSKSSEDQLFEHFYGSFPNTGCDHLQNSCENDVQLIFGDVTVNRITGRVHFPESTKLDEAAAAFWKAVGISRSLK